MVTEDPDLFCALAYAGLHSSTVDDDRDGLGAGIRNPAQSSLSTCDCSSFDATLLAAPLLAPLFVVHTEVDRSEHRRVDGNGLLERLACVTRDYPIFAHRQFRQKPRAIGDRLQER